MEKRATLRDIAAATGLHYSTVSLALRGDPRIQPATREAVRVAAERLNYHRDPMVQALAVYRTAIRPPEFQGTIAWLNGENPANTPGQHAYWQYISGAREAASEMGYQIEEFFYRSGPIAKRLERTLISRNIHGILIPPQPNDRIRTRIRLDWSRFAAIAFGHTLAWPPIHRVSNNQYRAARLAIRRLRSLGYRRIGLFVSERGNARVEEAWLAGYLAEMRRRGACPEPYLYNSWELNPAALSKWLAAHQLEAILCDNTSATVWILEHAGKRIPEELGVASLRLDQPTLPFAGVDQNENALGRIAANQLIGMLQRHERGLPAFPHRLLVEGTWRFGSTVRRINL